MTADNPGMQNTTIHILAIDDDKISRKMIAQALSENYRLDFADNGEQGLDIAMQLKPDLIILDVEMPGMNGYEVCDRLRQDDSTRDTPVIFLSSHSTLRERMQGYEAGANDYLLKPFENEFLLAKIKVLVKYREEQKQLQQQYEQAQKTAMIAMTGSSELGIAMQFVEKSYAFHSYSELAHALLQVCQQYQLQCVALVLTKQEHFWHTLDEAISPLEKEMMEMLDRNKRFIDFGKRTIINYPNLSLLVKNMPLDDMERYGRMKDLLCILLTAVDAKVKAIITDQALNEQSDDLMRSFGQIRSRLYYLAQTLVSNQNESTELLQKMVTELNADLLGMGLEDDQEAYIVHRLDTAIEDAKRQLDASSFMYVAFSGVLNNLKQIGQKQLELQQTFNAMNTPPDLSGAEENDGVEIFFGGVEMF
jgi:DNA-binding response OmpR family regulator